MSPVFLLPQPRKFSEAVCGWAPQGEPFRSLMGEGRLSAQHREQGPVMAQDNYAGDAGRDKDSLACFLGPVGAGCFQQQLSEQNLVETQSPLFWVFLWVS